MAGGVSDVRPTWGQRLWCTAMLMHAKQCFASSTATASASVPHPRLQNVVVCFIPCGVAAAAKAASLPATTASLGRRTQRSARTPWMLACCVRTRPSAHLSHTWLIHVSIGLHNQLQCYAPVAPVPVNLGDPSTADALQGARHLAPLPLSAPHGEATAVFHSFSTAGATDGALRLVEVPDVEAPPNAASGRVEVCYKGQWGAVCGDADWGYQDVKVFCR